MGTVTSTLGPKKKRTRKRVVEILAPDVMQFLELDPIAVMTKDLAKSAATLTQPQARYLADTYLTIQRYRLAMNNRISAMSKIGEPHDVIKWFGFQFERLENQAGRALEKWAAAHPVGEWMQSIRGLGGILAAGFLAHVDIEREVDKATLVPVQKLHSLVRIPKKQPTSFDEEDLLLDDEEDPTLIKPQDDFEIVDTFTDQADAAKALRLKRKENDPAWTYEVKTNLNRSKRPTLKQRTETVGHWWSFAGFVPNVIWEPGQKRPFCRPFRTLLFLAAESFVKQQKAEDDVYGKMYTARKRHEWRKNVSGELAEQAQESMRKKNYGEQTLAIHWYRGDYDARIARAYYEHGVPFTENMASKLPTVDEILASRQTDEDYQKFLKRYVPSLKAAGFETPDSLPRELKGTPMLCPAHIHRRAARIPVKTFLSHLHTVYYWHKYGELPPIPYVFSHMEGHVDYSMPPNTQMFPGLTDALQKRIGEIRSKW